MQYPNKYYAELGGRVISNSTLQLKEGEVCFYEADARSFTTTTTTTKSKPAGGKWSFFWTPWVAGVKHTGKTVTTTTETRQDYYAGRLYITNMRMVFKCQVDAFDLMITQIKSVKQYNNGIEVISGRKSFKVMTNDLKDVLHVIDLINKAQTSKEGPVEGPEYGANNNSNTSSGTELPFGWYSKNEAFVKPRDSKLYELLSAASSCSSIDEEKVRIQEYLDYFESYKKECASKGKHFKIYFDEMHMQYDAKKYSSPTQKQEERLKYIEENYDILKQEEIEKKLSLQTLEEDIINAIKSNPGVLQSELVKQFPECVKGDVTEKLYFWAREEKIRREKNGRSYSLYID